MKPDHELFFVQLRTGTFFCGLHVYGARELVRKLKTLEPTTVIEGVWSLKETV